MTTLATRVAEEQNTQLGRRVGYSIRFDECFMRNQTKIKYMTEGILIREMMEDPLLKASCFGTTYLTPKSDCIALIVFDHMNHVSCIPIVFTAYLCYRPTLS